LGVGCGGVGLELVGAGDRGGDALQGGGLFGR